MRTSFFQFALVAVLSGDANASASQVCLPSEASKASAMEVLHIPRDNLNPSRVLLGLDGSRIHVGYTMGPEPWVQPWHARVNWRKYAITPSHSPAAALLHFGKDDKGRQYLCRIDIRDYTDAYVKRNARVKNPADPQLSDIKVIEQTRMAYDMRYRLASVIRAQRNGKHRKFERTSTECFHYDDKDRFLGTSIDADSCPGFRPEKIQDRYVYDADGILLRKISTERSMQGLDGKRFVTAPARVIVFGQKGQPIAEYTDDEVGRHYRRSLAPNAEDSKYHAIKVVGSAASFDLGSLQNGKADGFWQLFSMPTSVANTRDGLYADRYLVASGETLSINMQERERIWKALSLPDHDMVLEGQGKFLIVPEVSPALWLACLNPRLTTREACS